MRAFLLRLTALLGVAALFAGCSSYHFGTGGKLGFKSLYIAPVVNESKLPQATALVSAQLREAFLRDGRVTLADSPATADAVLNIRLVDYTRLGQASQRNDSGLTRKYALTLNAEATLTKSNEDSPLFKDRKIEATREAFTDLGQLQSEYQAVPLLAETLAKNAVNATLDVW